MKRLAVSSATVAAVLLLSGHAAAQAIQNVVLRNSFNQIGAGARGMGMGGAFIAVADDGTAASFNPAGLAQLRRTELAVVGFGDELRSTLEIPGFEGTETVSHSGRHEALDFIGLSVPFEVGGRNLTVQLSYQRSVDLFGRGSATVQENIPFSEIGLDRPGTVATIADISPDQSGAFHTGSMAAAYQVTERLSLGASVNYWVAEWLARGDANFRLVLASAGQRPVEFYRVEKQFSQEQGFRAANVNLGLLLKYPRLSLGGVIRLPFTGDYELTETAHERDFDLGQPAGVRDSATGLRSRLRWPRSLGVGVALRPFSGLTLAADYAKSYWSRAIIEDVPQGALLTPRPPVDDEGNEQPAAYRNLNFFDLLPPAETAIADTDQWRVGAEYLLTIPKVVLPFRAGLFRDRSPVVELGTREGRKIEGFTLGTGLNFSRLALDVAFERRRSEGRVGLRVTRGEGEPSSNAPTEEVEEDRFVGSIVYRFGGEDDPMKRLFHFLFVGPRDEPVQDDAG